MNTPSRGHALTAAPLVHRGVPARESQDVGWGERRPLAPGRSPCRAPPRRAPAWTCTPARRTCARAAVGVGSPRARRCGEPARTAVWGTRSPERGKVNGPARAGPHLLNGRPSASSPASPARAAPQPVYLYRTRSCCMLPKHTCAPGPGLSFRPHLLLLRRSAGSRRDAGRAGQHQVVAGRHKLAYVLVWRLDLARLQPSQPVQTHDALKLRRRGAVPAWDGPSGLARGSRRACALWPPASDRGSSSRMSRTRKCSAVQRTKKGCATPQRPEEQHASQTYAGGAADSGARACRASHIEVQRAALRRALCWFCCVRCWQTCAGHLNKSRLVTTHDQPRRAPVHLRPLRHLLLCRLPRSGGEARSRAAAENRPASIQHEAESWPRIESQLLHVRVSQARAWPGRDRRKRAAMRHTPQESCCAERSKWRASLNASAVCLA